MTSEAGKKIKKPVHRVDGKFSQHPDVELYQRIEKTALDGLYALGLNNDEIKVFLDDPEPNTSMFKRP